MAIVLFSLKVTNMGIETGSKLSSAVFDLAVCAGPGWQRRGGEAAQGQHQEAERSGGAAGVGDDQTAGRPRGAPGEEPQSSGSPGQRLQVRLQRDYSEIHEQNF